MLVLNKNSQHTPGTSRLMGTTLPPRLAGPVRLIWTFREVFLIIGAYLLYMFARKVILGDVESTALNNAGRLIAAESHLGILWEPGWQEWAIDHARWLVVTMNWSYFMTFAPIIATVAFIYYMRDRSRYFYYRNIIMVSYVVALAIFIFFPLAPPRFIADMGFVDTIKVYGPSQYAGREMAWFYNVFAAMPSLHFGWTILIGAVLFFSHSNHLAGFLAFKFLGIAYPTLTLFAITITGNHYILDAVGGAAVALISFLVYVGLRRWWRSTSCHRLYMTAQTWLQGINRRRLYTSISRSPRRSARTT